MKIIIILLCGLAGFSSAAKKNETSPGKQIVNGAYAYSMQQFGYMASIYKDGSSWCGGGIVSAKIVLTAAHCVHNHNAQSFEVRVGNLDRSKGFAYPVYFYATHPYYNSVTYVADAAVLILYSRLSFTPTVYPLLVSTTVPTAGTYVTIAGWGNTETEVAPLLLRTATVLVSTCSQIYLTDFCAVGYNYQDSCYGDSGSPVVLNSQIVGLTSTVSCGRNANYVKVAAIKDFVTLYMNAYP